ncbi:unnamed protein product [Debaryomyces tyrocola]|nr:unnamed protein product [Debaryomyces tyrocola]
MAIPFPDIEPYDILEVTKSSTPIEIKKSYKRLCLKYHPDKIQQASSIEDREFFPKLQFSYSILSDSLKRQRYDNTGSLGVGEDDIDDEYFNWKDYFDSMNEKITIDMIEEDKLKYQHSTEEKDDILHNFVYYEGDFIKLFEVIPHLDFDEALEDRVFRLIEDAINNQEFDTELDQATLKSWEKYKKSRKTKVKQMLKKLAKEAKEAEELEKQIKDKGRRSLKNENDLKSLIQSRQSNRMDSLINKLETKYADKKGKKRKPTEISDDEFERIQNSLGGNKNRKRKG